MAIAITLKNFLDQHNAHYQLIQHPRSTSTLQTCEVAHVPGSRMAKSVLLGDDRSYLMVVLPATRTLNLNELSLATGRDLSLISEDELASAFSDCEVGALPPIGEPYGIETVVDDTLPVGGSLYFESGDHELLIEMPSDEFSDLIRDTSSLHVSRHI